MMKKTNRTADSLGFTLIEVMIVVVVIAILAAVALPSYTEYVNRSKRAEAKATMINLAQRLERCFTEHNAYNDGACPVADNDSVTSVNGHYTVVVTSAATTYTLTATPVVSDPRCGTLSLTNTGARTSNDNDYCW